MLLSHTENSHCPLKVKQTADADNGSLPCYKHLFENEKIEKKEKDEEEEESNEREREAR